MKTTKKLTLDVFIERSNKTHGNKYDYSKSIYKNSSTKIKIICPTHGEFEQKPQDHMNGRGCVECGFLKNTRKKSLTNFINSANEIHNGKYDYTKSIYVDSKTKIKIICPTHGEFEQNPDTHMRGSGCVKCGHEKSGRRKNTQDFISGSIKIHGCKYDYSAVVYINNKKKVKIICPTHGAFKQSPNAHLNGAGCFKCSVESRAFGKRLGVGDFLKKANKKHNNTYDYSLVKYINNSTPITIQCDTHGPFQQLPGNHLRGCRCPKCASFISKSEIEIGNILDDIGVDYEQHDNTLITPYEIDFKIPDHNIAIEFDGIYFHSENVGGKDKKYHLRKTEQCGKNGYRLIHIFENEYVAKYNILKFKIRSIFGKNKYKIFARKCVIKSIDHQTKKNFNIKYHIQGDSQSCVNLGLFFKGRLIQVMTFSKRRKALGSTHRNGEYELSRMSSMKGFTVVGGASKLLKHFEKNYNPIKLISYADRRWSNGGVYEKMGFVFVKNTPPNYWYFHKKNTKFKLFHRYKFAKHTLHRQLEIFDDNLTEWENMKINGYDRIWDCGNIHYEKVY